MTASSIKRKSLIFIILLAITIIATLVIIIISINQQKNDAAIINKAGRQRMLSQRIAKIILLLNYHKDLNLKSNTYTIDSLNKISKEWKEAYEYLKSINSEEIKSPKLDSLYNVCQYHQQRILSACFSIVKSDNPKNIKGAIPILIESELPFLFTMEAVVKEHQLYIERKLFKIKVIAIVISSISLLMLIITFIYLILPIINTLIEKNKNLETVYNDLLSTEEELRSSFEHINVLKEEMEKKYENNKIFVDQSPNAIAMFDSNMRYLAASQKWIEDYKLKGLELLGKSHYEIFPEIGDDWKQIHQECLHGAINKCDEAYFERANGTSQWITWDVRPWYESEGKIGGIIMYTADITKLKEKDAENRRIQAILDKSNEVTLTGTWDVNLATNKVTWSKITKEIHEVDYYYEPNLASSIAFYKEGESRTKISNTVSKSMQDGSSFDIELQIITAKGNEKWVRAIGLTEFENGKCKRIYGVFQDITKIKNHEIGLSNYNEELTAILNSSNVSIISTNLKGIITHFNRGAELLLQYRAEEMVGKATPAVIHLDSEVIKRGEELTTQMGRTVEGFDVFVEFAKKGEYESREWTYVRRDGSTFPVQLVVTAIYNQHGKINGFLGIATDITDLKQAKNRLESLASTLQKKNNQLLSFAHITSHNLRSPIVNLNSLLHFIKIAESVEESKLLIEKLDKVVIHINETLNYLIDALKVQEDTDVAHQELSFEQVFNETIEILAGQIMSTEAEITHNFSKVESIFYPKSYLDSIFLNLMSNAIKYRSPNRKPKIHFETNIEKGIIILTVSDNGLGIDLNKYKDKLFGLNKTFHRHSEAKGVGLYMTKTQVEAMGGTITLDSEVDLGSTFKIHFSKF